jgi:hypothetical protein
MSLYLGFVSLILLVFGPALAYLAAVPPLVGFAVAVASIPFGLLAVVGGVIASKQKKQRRKLLSVLFGAPSLIAFGFLGFQGLVHPRINDISTDLEHPPEFRAAAAAPELAGQDLSYPHQFVSKVREHYRELVSLLVAAPPQVVLDAAVDMIRERDDCRITRVDRKRGELEGVAVSQVFNFRDDFVIRVRSDHRGTRVDMRSRSRDGKSDLGANAARIRDFLGELQKRLVVPSRTASTATL